MDSLSNTVWGCIVILGGLLAYLNAYILRHATPKPGYEEKVEKIKKKVGGINKVFPPIAIACGILLILLDVLSKVIAD